MKLQAIKGHVILQAIEKPNTTEAGLILQSSQEQQTEARIISVGSTVESMKVGDRVLVDWNRVGKVNFENEIYYVTGQSNIIGVFED